MKILHSIITAAVNGSEIVRRRKARGLNGKQFAKMLGISQQYLSDIERRGKTVPGFLYRRILKVLRQHSQEGGGE